MIVATITVIALLFGGGVNEIFFIDKLEKGVKEYVIDKERQKDILADLKKTKKLFKKFNKERKARFKTYKKINSSRIATREELIDFYDELNKERIEFQDELIDDRLTVSKKIKADEWASIVEHSGNSVDKRKEKEQKKSEKNKNKGQVPLEKTRKAIIEIVSDAEKQKVMIGGLNDMISSFEKLESEIKSINVKENNVLILKDAKKEELKQIAAEMNNLRHFSFKQLIEFHMVVKENTDESEWDKIMKAFNKELAITTR